MHLVAGDDDRALVAARQRRDLAPARARLRAPRRNSRSRRARRSRFRWRRGCRRARRSARGIESRWRSTQNASDSDNATLRPAACATAPLAERLLGRADPTDSPPDRVIWAASMVASSMSSGPSSTTAPRKVFIVRCASGVTKIRQRAVGSRRLARRRIECDADDADVVAKHARPTGRRAPCR